jgi:hypothetical protein
MIVQCLRSTAYGRPPIKNRRRGIVKGDDLKSMSIDELWKLHEAVAFELNQKLAAEKAKLEQRLGELQGDDDASGPDPPAHAYKLRWS